MTGLTELTQKVSCGSDIGRAEVGEVVQALLDDNVTDDAKAEFLTALARKGETAEEIAAFAMQLRARALDPQVDPAKFGGVLLDVCGTGADMAHTFNISSCVTFVVAAAGVAVVKHGNRAITSKCGSADVLAALGARIELPPDAARRCLQEVGVTFFFAPLYHPAFKKIAPVRKKLAERKQRTVFNILGPLVNPARPTHQLVGIFDRALVPKYAEVLRLLGLQRFLVVHGDGLDELSVCGPNITAGLALELPALHAPRSTLDALAGGDPAANAQIVREVLGGKDRGPRRDIVLLNAAAALVVSDKVNSFESGCKLAAQMIDSGAANEKLARFVQTSNRV